MKQGPKRIVSAVLTAGLGFFLFTGLGAVSNAFGQSVSEQEKQLRHSIEFWESVVKDNKVILVPLSAKMSGKEKQRYIDSRPEANFRGHYVQDPKSRKYYVPEERDAFLRKMEAEMIAKGTARAQIDQMKRSYDADSSRMKQYVTGERLPRARRDLARLQPPIPAATGEQRRLELNALIDKLVKKWAKDLEESKKIAKDSGPHDELANLGYWATMHLKLYSARVASGTPEMRNTFMEYLGCLDRVYSSHYPTGKQIRDGKYNCLEATKR